MIVVLDLELTIWDRAPLAALQHHTYMLRCYKGLAIMLFAHCAMVLAGFKGDFSHIA